jgi:DNA-binding Lrp family transcriptional regulator
MDELDRGILTRLQADSGRPVAALAEEVGLSTSACHRRVRLLEEKGLVAGYAARLDPDALGLTIEVFVDISLSGQDEKTLDAFERAVERHPEILECWLTAGRADYHLHIMARDMGDYDRIHRQVLSRLPGVASMHTRFALRRIKPFRGYPVA